MNSSSYLQKLSLSKHDKPTAEYPKNFFSSNMIKLIQDKLSQTRYSHYLNKPIINHNKTKDTQSINHIYEHKIQYVQANLDMQNHNHDPSKNLLKSSNRKLMLCEQYMKNMCCIYGNKCIYAHDIKDQNISQSRYNVYSYIFNPQNIKLTHDIYKSLLIMCDICDKCMLSHCIGGINCRNGVYYKGLKLCRTDLLYGNCVDDMCDSIHITSKYIKPLSTYKDFYTDKEQSVYDTDSDNSDDTTSIQSLDDILYEQSNSLFIIES